jgi:hypothetical protein
MSPRRGISLVELMLTLSACCVILTMSAGLIHRAMHAHTKGRKFFDGERSALRLGESFRRDVHAATAAVTGDAIGDAVGDELLVRLELPGGQSIEYRQAAGRVERLWHVDGSVRAREAFTFPPETRLVASQESPSLIVLEIVPPEVAAEPADGALSPYSVIVSLRAEAILGRHASLVEITNAPEQTP